jgi:asparagine synthase (glutamine-hydrolysing)
MFSFAIYDSKDRTLFIARDRLGKKPLFYTTYGGMFIFASELKAILNTGLVPVDVDDQAVNFYFALGYIPGEMCIAKHVRKLASGCFLQYKLACREVALRRYWDAPEYEFAKDEVTALAEVEEILSDSVRRRLISDVPLGVFLSGGVDSSLVAAFMRKVHNGEIKTFSVGFEGSRRSELRYASLVARHLETNHKEIIVRPNIADDLELVSGLLDEPIFDNSILPTYYLSRHTRQHVTVALSGDGGDELFGGYIHYASALASRKIARFAVPPLNMVAGAMARMMPEGLYGKNTLYGVSLGGGLSFVGPTRVFKSYEIRGLFTKDFLGRIETGAPDLYRERLMDRNYDFLNRMCYADLKTSLADDILVKVDRASMFNSLEVRCPLLDYRLAEYSFRHLPGSLKIKGGIKKYLLKKLAEKYLPPELDIARKQGFDMPGDLLSGTYLAGRLLDFPPNEFISRSHLERTVKKSGRAFMWHKLFSLYFFMRWIETWGR